MKKYKLQWTRRTCTDIFSVISQNFSEMSSLVKKWVGGQKYMGKKKIHDVIDTHLPLKNFLFKLVSSYRTK